MRRKYSVLQKLVSFLLLLSFVSCTIDTGNIQTGTMHKGTVHELKISEGLTFNFEVIKDVEYSRHADISLLADIYVPSGLGPYPGILLIHGGGWSGGYRTQMNGFAERLAKNGFAVVNIDYRLAPTYQFPAQIDDCEEAVRWMRKKSATYKINPDKIGAWGYSAGAHLAALLGTRNEGAPNAPKGSERIQAVVGGAGPYDLTKDPDDPSILKFLGNTIEENPEIFRSASPVFHVNTLSPPMFLYHGTWDRIVDLERTTEMKTALDQAGVENQMYLVRGLGHISLFLFGWPAERNAVQFLKYHLL